MDRTVVETLFARSSAIRCLVVGDLMLDRLEDGDLLAEHQVDVDVLSALTEQDMEKLGIPLGDRKRFIQAIAKPPSARPSSLGPT